MKYLVKIYDDYEELMYSKEIKCKSLAEAENYAMAWCVKIEMTEGWIAYWDVEAK